MISLNEKCVITQKIQIKDQYGSITEMHQKIGDFWCHIILQEGFTKNTKGGKKRVREIKLHLWIDKRITAECNIIYDGIEYCIVNVTHSRKKGITTITAIFND